MNEVQIRVDFEKQICEPVGKNLITGDYNSTKLVFTFDREDGTKLFKMKNPNDETIFAQEIINNEVVLVGETEQGEAASLFKSAGDYVIEIALYDGDSRLTSIYSVLSVLQEQIVLDGGEEIVVYKPLFDQLIQDLTTAITETNNLDIDVNKEGDTTTVDLTKKDGTTKSVQIKDGEKGDTGDCFYAIPYIDIETGIMMLETTTEADYITFEVNEEGYLEAIFI